MLVVMLWYVAMTMPRVVTKGAASIPFSKYMEVSHTYWLIVSIAAGALQVFTLCQYIIFISMA